MAERVTFRHSFWQISPILVPIIPLKKIALAAHIPANASNEVSKQLNWRTLIRLEYITVQRIKFKPMILMPRSLGNYPGCPTQQHWRG